MDSTTSSDQRRELAHSQLWETLSTLAKAGYFFIATPALLAHLGQGGYGLFAMASSVLVCVLTLDFGLRPWLRVALSALPRGDEAAWSRTLAGALGTFLAIQLAALTVAIAGAHTGLWSRWFSLGAGGDRTLVAALAGSSAYVLSLMLIEPLAAQRRLSLVKAAMFFGNALAVPVVVWLAKSGAGAEGCFLGYAASLTVPNLLLTIFRQPRALAALLRAPASLHPRETCRIIFKGRWFALLTAQWLVKGYVITFVISAIFGPAEAGVFFILLKLAELLTVFGTNTSETATAELAAHLQPAARRERFGAAFRATLAASAPAFAGLAALTPIVLDEWFHLGNRGAAIGVLVGAYGLAGGFNRVVAAACMGVGLIRSVALWGLLETALALGGALALREVLGIPGVFVAGVFGALALFPPARAVARALEQPARRVWLRPAIIFLAGVAASACCAVLANRAHEAARWAWLAAGLACGAAVTAHSIRGIRAGL